jgi:hypothetical protein
MTTETPRHKARQLPLVLVTRDLDGSHVHLNPQALPADLSTDTQERAA